ncbi:Forkhead box protein P2 [Glugoides intestinalis]
MQDKMTKTIKVLKDFTYYSLIKEAIYSTENMQATSSEIFTYFVLKYQDLFKQSNSMTWKGNIRQVLSKNPEFVKLKKHGNTKEHYWTHRPVEEIEEKENRKNFELKGGISLSRYPNLVKARLEECLCKKRRWEGEDKKKEIEEEAKKEKEDKIESKRQG